METRTWRQANFALDDRRTNSETKEHVRRVARPFGIQLPRRRLPARGPDSPLRASRNPGHGADRYRQRQRCAAVLYGGQEARHSSAYGSRDYRRCRRPLHASGGEPHRISESMPPDIVDETALGKRDGGGDGERISEVLAGTDLPG